MQLAASSQGEVTDGSWTLELVVRSASSLDVYAFAFLHGATPLQSDHIYSSIQTSIHPFVGSFVHSFTHSISKIPVQSM